MVRIRRACIHGLWRFFFFFFLQAEIFVLTLFEGTMFDFEEKNMTLTRRAFCCENKLHIGEKKKKYFISNFFYEIVRPNVFRFLLFFLFFCQVDFRLNRFMGLKDIESLRHESYK